MKKLNVLTRMLLLVALLVGSVNVWGEDYELYSGTITEGDYVIYYNGKTLRNTTSSNRFTNGTATPVENKITNPSSEVVWHIAANGDYWTIYNASVEKYAGGTGTKNQGALLSSVTNYAKWTITGTSTYEFENLGRANGSSDKNNKWLRNNGDNGWACYATGTGGAVSLYKKVEESGEATTVTIDDSEITNTNKFVSTSAGSFSASVIYGSPASAVPGAVVTWSSETESVATINETTGVVTLVGAGTTKIVASYAGVENEYKSSFAEYVLTVTDEDPTLLYEEKTSFKSGETDGTLKTLITYESNQGGAGTAPAIYNSGIRLYQISGTNKYGGYITMTAPEGYKITGFAITTTSTYASTTVDYTVDGSTNVGEGESLAKNSEYAKDGLFNSSVSVFNLGTGSSGRLEIASIRVYYIPVVPVKIGSHGWTSLISDKILDFEGIDGLNAYAAKLNETTVTLNDVTEVPANKGIVLRGTASETYYVPVLASTEANVETDLTGSATAAYNKVGGMFYYVLANKNGVEGFYEYTGDAAIPAGKAFFETSSQIPDPDGKFSIVFADDETDGIRSIENGKLRIENSDYYNLAGQRVGKDYKGIVIVNGKKMLNK